MQGLLLVLNLVAVTGLDGQTIFINPDEIIAMGTPRKTETTLHPNVKCVITTTDWHFISVIEECESIREQISRGGP